MAVKSLVIREFVGCVRHHAPDLIVNSFVPQQVGISHRRAVPTEWSLNPRSRVPMENASCCRFEDACHHGGAGRRVATSWPFSRVGPPPSVDAPRVSRHSEARGPPSWTPCRFARPLSSTEAAENPEAHQYIFTRPLIVVRVAGRKREKVFPKRLFAGLEILVLGEEAAWRAVARSGGCAADIASGERSEPVHVHGVASRPKLLRERDSPRTSGVEFLIEHAT